MDNKELKKILKLFIKKIIGNRKYSFLGYKYYCSICKNKLRLFLPLPEYYKKSAMKYGYKYFGQNEHINVSLYTCPVCKSSDRDRFYASYFNQFQLPENLNKTLLHIAPAKSLNNLFLKKHFKVTTTDLFMDGVDYKLNIEDMHEFENNQFDYFICSHVIEHVENPDKALQELYRILKPGGKGIIMVPIIPKLEETLENPEHRSIEDRIRYYGQYDHLRLFAKHDFIGRVESVNFKLSQLGINDFGKSIYKKLGLKESSILYVVSK